LISFPFYSFTHPEFDGSGSLFDGALSDFRGSSSFFIRGKEGGGAMKFYGI